MANTNGLHRYNVAAINLHWLTLVMMIAIYATIEAHEMIPRGNPWRGATEDWHIYLGFVLLPIVLYRMVNMLRSQVPPITPTPPAWQMVVTRAMKVYLYVLMLGAPLLGWIYLSADAASINVWGIPLPPIAPASEGLAELAEEGHKLLGTSGYVFVTVHALAALYHHYLVKDDTLRRMLPAFFNRKG